MGSAGTGGAGLGEKGGGGEAGDVEMVSFYLSLIFFVSFVITSPVRLAVRGDEKATS